MSERTGTLPPSAAAQISRLLSKAGHERAESESTSVRGYRRSYPGFTVRSGTVAWHDGYDTGAGVVVVTHDPHSSSHVYGPGDARPDYQAIRRTALATYETALKQAGFQVETIERPRHRDAYLLVSGRVEQ